MPRQALPRLQTSPLIGLVVPMYNERAVLPLFLERTEAALKGHRFVVLFVDDGSRDDSAAWVAEQAQRKPYVQLLKLSRNFGKEAALAAGFDHVRGDVVVPLDADLQDPPELIPEMVRLWQSGAKVVIGVRSDRLSDAAGKRASAGWFYRIFNWLSPVKLVPHAGDFRLMDRVVVEALRGLPERTRFLKGLYSWVGYTTALVPYSRPQRAAGQTKWNAWRLWNYALEGIFSFSAVPLRIWTYLGGVIAGISFLYGSYIVLLTVLVGRETPGFASLFVAVTFLGGLQLVGMGLLGEYLARVFTEVKQRPLYLVEEKVNV